MNTGGMAVGATTECAVPSTNAGSGCFVDGADCLTGGRPVVRQVSSSCGAVRLASGHAGGDRDRVVLA
jgi:hypothetical protein